MSGWWPPGRWRWSVRGRLREHLLVLAGLVAYVGAVYIAVVVVVGLFLGRSDTPSVLLSVAATAVVAVGFEPVRRRLRAWANRLSGPSHPLPYDVLAGFAPDSGASAQDTPVWMAKVLADKGYDYQFVFARNSGHCDRPTKLQTFPEALEWLWKGYPIDG